VDDQTHRNPLAGPDGDGTGDRLSFHEWLTINALHPARYAGLYPVRVLSRYMDPTGRSEFWNPQGQPYKLEQARGLFEALPKAGIYEPGTRESSNVEDRRPRSSWEY
jgi:hypothetical protein